VAALPPEKERVWFWEVVLRITSSAQLVLASPRPVRAVGRRLPLATWSWMKERYSSPVSTSKIWAAREWETEPS
jgi:hypothetical protein